MELSTDHFFHIYNRSNNSEIVFKDNNNYQYFLKKYRHYLNNYFDTLAYCLMPTHFHLLVKVKSEKIDAIKKNFGLWLSSYTKAINKRYNRHGSLFQQHTKSKWIHNERYLIMLLGYIHQNPLRWGLVNKPEEWEFSSYPDYIGLKRSGLRIIHMESALQLIKDYFSTIEEFKDFSNRIIEKVKEKDWV